VKEWLLFIERTTGRVSLLLANRVLQFWKTDKIKDQKILSYLPVLCIIKLLEETEEWRTRVIEDKCLKISMCYDNLCERKKKKYFKKHRWCSFIFL